LRDTETPEQGGEPGAAGEAPTGDGMHVLLSAYMGNAGS
jgi:hypothetical protein